jgi:uncharacterized phiE125 gp8 family phage protein
VIAQRWKVIAAPTEEPITIEEARNHLEAARYAEVDSDGAPDPVDEADDAMIMDKLAAAREHCEAFLGLSLSIRTLEIAMDEFPAKQLSGGDIGIEFPMGPVREVVSVTYGETSDGMSLAAEDFTLDDYSKPSRLMPIASAWPVVTNATNTVKVRYLAGYGVDSDGGEPLPKSMRAAILLVLGELFANRENAGDTALTEIPTSAQALLRPHRVRLGMA